MRKRNAAGRPLPLRSRLWSPVAPARAAVEDGLLSARVASFDNGVGAAVTFHSFHTLFPHGARPGGIQPLGARADPGGSFSPSL